MKKLLLVLALFPLLSFGSGKLQIKPGYFFKAEKFGGQAGLSIYEKITDSVALNQWLGIGSQPRAFEESVFYAVSETSFESWYDKLGLAVGYKFQHADKSNEPVLISEHGVFFKAYYKLW